MSTKYSLIIPCYNEAKNLPFLIERIANAYANEKGFEIILVNNGSSDESESLLQEAVLKYSFLKTVHVPVNKGYGYGIIQGLNSAQGDYIGWTHADMQTDPSDAKIGFKFFETNKDPEKLLVKGLRYGRPLSDVMFTMGMSVFDSLLFFLPMWDINAQPTLFSKKFYETWQNAPHDFALDLFAYAIAKKNKFNVCRFSVNFADRLHGTSHWNINWKSKLKFIKRTIDFSIELRKTWKK